jgi:hypothetical protein
MSDIDTETSLTLAKFYISENLLQFTIFYSQTFDILFNFASEIAAASDDLKIAASQVLQGGDFMYEDVKVVQHPSGAFIVVYEGNRIRVVLLLKKQVMNPLVQQYLKTVIKDFTESFEDKFRKQLKDYENYTGNFSDIDDIMEKTFLLDLSFPHIARYKGFDPEDKLEEYIFQAADAFAKRVGYFYLRNLLFLTKQHVIDEARNIVLSDPDRAKREGIDPMNIEFPSDEFFFTAMFKMRKLGMLEPIQIDELSSYSKIQY